ncbi:MAG: DUF1232 domain-containing protein [Pseudomonadales bacterium]|nr:DUF1232 domain-containing protein [Pseudomonadales bacterium]
MRNTDKANQSAPQKVTSEEKAELNPDLFLPWWQQWRNTARDLPQYLYRLYLVSRDSRTPKLAKLICLLVLAYALSPIDLIPDFIPLIGHLDDLILVPLAIWLVRKMIPDEVWSDYADRRTRVLPHLKKLAYGFALLMLLFWAAICYWLVVTLFL